MKIQRHLGAFFVGIFSANAQSFMYLGGANTGGHQSHRLVVQEPLGKKWQTTAFAQSLEGIRHGILGFGPVYRFKGYEVNPIAAVAAGGNHGNHAIAPALTVFKESRKWLFDLQAICLIGRKKNSHGCMTGPVDSVWQIGKHFRLGLTGQIGHWQGYASANVGPEFRYLVPKMHERMWLTADIKPVMLMVGGHGPKHMEVGFGFVINLAKQH